MAEHVLTRGRVPADIVYVYGALGVMLSVTDRLSTGQPVRLGAGGGLTLTVPVSLLA